MRDAKWVLSRLLMSLHVAQAQQSAELVHQGLYETVHMGLDLQQKLNQLETALEEKEMVIKHFKVQKTCLKDANEKLKAENAKLKEQLQDAWFALVDKDAGAEAAAAAAEAGDSNTVMPAFESNVAQTAENGDTSAASQALVHDAEFVWM